MRHFTVVEDYLMAKNALHTDVKALFRKADRVILEDDATWSRFIMKIHTDVYHLNQAHKRCTPVKVDVYNERSEDLPMRLVVAGVVTMRVYKERAINPKQLA